MTRQGSILVLFLCCLTAAASDDASCYRIEPGIIAGIVCADVLLTVAVAVLTYRCAASRRQRRERAEEVYMNVRANCK